MLLYLDLAYEKASREGRLRTLADLQGAIVEGAAKRLRPKFMTVATKAQEPIEEDMEVRSAIQNVFVEHKRRYGYRRVSKELRRRGMLVNHKRLMREDNLLAVQP